MDPVAMIAVAGHAEDRGFGPFYVPEHIALYPGAAPGAQPIPPSLPITGPLECLSFAAAATERILTRSSTRAGGSIDATFADRLRLR